MGYHTEFEGGFSIEPVLTPEDREFLVNLNATRRMGRKGLDPKYGVEGEWYVANTKNYGQERTPDIIDYNEPPITQPSLWCQWVPNKDGTLLEWDGGEKAYDMQEWIAYLLERYLKPRGYTLNGYVSAQGEEEDDTWSIDITDNVIDVHNKEFMAPSVIQTLNKLREVPLEDIPRLLTIKNQIEAKSKYRMDYGDGWVLATINERIAELEGTKDA